PPGAGSAGHRHAARRGRAGRRDLGLGSGGPRGGHPGAAPDPGPRRPSRCGRQHRHHLRLPPYRAAGRAPAGAAGRGTGMKAARGFTLLEILVAMAIFAVVSVLAYGGLASISRQFEVTSDAQARLQEIRRGVALIERDLMQFVNRPVRDAFQGELLPPLRGGVDVDIPLELTRAGWRNPTGMPRPTLQRVAWQRIDDRLERLHWIVLDRAQDAQPVRLEVLDGVTGFELRFLDASGEWQEQWPPLD